MSTDTDYYQVSEYPFYQTLDITLPDPVFDVVVPETLDIALPDVVVSETSDFDSIKDALEKLVKLDLPNFDYFKDALEKFAGLDLSDPDDEDEYELEHIEKKQTLIYRFSLPLDSSIAEYEQFKRNIEWIKNKNPKWEVIPDLPTVGEESEAWIMIYKDENYLDTRISYLVNSSISTSSI